MCSETNVMHFLFSLLKLRTSTCFEHYLLIHRRRYTSATWYIACMLCQLAAPRSRIQSNRNAPRIWRDFGSALPFQTCLTQSKPALPLPNEHVSQVKDQGRRQCCHAKHKKIPYRHTRDVSLLSGHGNTE
jgi:hypothetical protein